MFRRNVLIFHAGALGDFILSWPLALALGRLYPQSRIIYVTHASKGALAEKALRVESSDAEAGWACLYGDAAKLPEACRRGLNGAHLVLSFVAGEGDRWMFAARAAADGAEVVPLRPRPPEDFQQHASQFLLQQLQSRPAIHTAVQQILSSIAAAGIGASRQLDGVIIHPGSGSPGKCWPLQNFLELSRLLRDNGRRVRILLGEVEQERWPAGQLPACREVAEVVQPSRYVDLLDVLKTAGLFIGNDSGPGHLAGAIGVPVISLFGSTDPAVWRPLGPRVQVIRQEPLLNLTVPQVYEMTKQARQP